MIDSLASFLRRFSFRWLELAFSKTADVLPLLSATAWLEAYKKTVDSGGYTVGFLSTPTERLLVNLEEKFNLALRGQIAVDANLLQRALSFFRAFSDYLKSPALLPPPFFGEGKDSAALESLWAWAGYPVAPAQEDAEKVLRLLETKLLPSASAESLKSLGLVAFWKDLCKGRLPSWSAMQERRFSALLLDMEDTDRVVTRSLATAVVWLRSLWAFQSKFLEKKNAAPPGTSHLALLSFGEVLDLSQATQIALEAYAETPDLVVSLGGDSGYDLPREIGLPISEGQRLTPSQSLNVGRIQSPLDSLDANPLLFRRFLRTLRSTFDQFLRECGEEDRDPS